MFPTFLLGCIFFYALSTHTETILSEIGPDIVGANTWLKSILTQIVPAYFLACVKEIRFPYENRPNDNVMGVRTEEKYTVLSECDDSAKDGYKRLVVTTPFGQKVEVPLDNWQRRQPNGDVYYVLGRL